MERIPILQMGEFLLVTIQVDMHDQLALTLQEDLTERISSTSARGVLIDISALDMVDSFIGRMIASISGLSRILDAETMVVGMQPAVAITLVELGLTLPGVSTALNVERGMQVLRQRVSQNECARKRQPTGANRTGCGTGASVGAQAGRRMRHAPGGPDQAGDGSQ